MDTLDATLATILKTLGIKKLNPVQQFAEKEGFFAESTDIALMSQSRTGKTFAGLLHIANTIFKAIKTTRESGCKETGNELAIIVAPFHAAARETASIMSQYFGWFLRPIVLVSASLENEVLLRLSSGTCPNVMITTPDALKGLLRVEETEDWIKGRDLKTIVFDDIHSILHDPNRGLSLFELVRYFKHQEQKPRIILLSGEFENPTRLEQFFDVRLLKDPREYDSPDIDLVTYKTTDEKQQLLVEKLSDLADEGSRTLVYMNSIAGIDKFLATEGSSLATSVSFDIDSLVTDRLRKIGDILQELDYTNADHIAGGIGCYHGQMSGEQRWFIEWAFRRRYLRFLFGTEALAFGLNTPVSDVIMSAPGMDEVFRQSMMARAIRMRRGKGQPGNCAVFTKTITDENELERVYHSPRLPLRFADFNNISNVMLGLIGHGIIQNDAERKDVAKDIALFFKKGSSEKIVRELLEGDSPLLADNGYTLTNLGKSVFTTNLSGEQVKRLVESLQLLQKAKKPPSIFDLLLILTYAGVSRITKKSQKEMDNELQQFFTSIKSSALSPFIIDTDREPIWKNAIEYSSVLYSSANDDIDFSSKSRKTIPRLKLDVRRFQRKFSQFLSIVLEKSTWQELGFDRKIIESLQNIIDSKEWHALIFTHKAGGDSSLRFRNLSFIDFSEIERSIDAILTSELSPVQKIKLLELLESVDATTSKFVDLMVRSKDDPKVMEILETVCEYSHEGMVGNNLVKALEEEGILEKSAINSLVSKFSSRVDAIKKRTDTPAKAGRVLFSLFTGDIVGVATSGLELLRDASDRTRRVDTSGLS